MGEVRRATERVSTRESSFGGEDASAARLHACLRVRMCVRARICRASERECTVHANVLGWHSVQSNPWRLEQSRQRHLTSGNGVEVEVEVCANKDIRFEVRAMAVRSLAISRLVRNARERHGAATLAGPRSSCRELAWSLEAVGPLSSGILCKNRHLVAQPRRNRSVYTVSEYRHGERVAHLRAKV